LTYISHNVTMYGYDPAEMIASPQFYQTIIHPDDALKILESWTRIVMEGSEPQLSNFACGERWHLSLARVPLHAHPRCR